MREFRHIFHIHEISPSRFEGEDFLGPEPNIPSPNSDMHDSRLTHLDWVLSSQGEFLDLHRKSMEAIMNADGPLPVPWRHYIAMLAASDLSCEYLVRAQLELFLASGGDPEWLTEPATSVPRKLQCLGPLSETMAYRPWELDSSHIESVTSAGRWSASELVHALLILATFHALPSLVFGSGLRIEDDLTLPEESCHCSSGLADALLDWEPAWDETAALPRCFSLNDSAPSLLQRLLQQANPASMRSLSSSAEEPIAAFEGFGALNENVPSGSASPSTAPPASKSATHPRTAGRLGEEEKEELATIMASQPKWRSIVASVLNPRKPGGEYRDFSQKTDRILHSMSFSWEDHGMMVLSRQMPEATDRIHEEHMHALEFTSHSIGGQHIESTTNVREAIVKYVQRMYGVFHDDYKYDQLNKILPVIHKAYLKKLACYPDRLTRPDYLRMRKFEGFTALDLIHYAHLVSQTKRVVELTWAMRAVMTFQASHSAA
jgi:sestrin